MHLVQGYISGATEPLLHLLNFPHASSSRPQPGYHITLSSATMLKAHNSRPGSRHSFVRSQQALLQEIHQGRKR
jgi:hypothetical protein